MPDYIEISSLSSLHLPDGLGPSAFGLSPAPPCPVSVSLRIHLNDQVVPSCLFDDTMGGLGINYSSVSKEIIKLTNSHSWSNPRELMVGISRIPLDLTDKVVERVEVTLELPKASLSAKSIWYSAVFDHDQLDGRAWRCDLRGIRVKTIIGLHPHEREERQWIEVDVGVNGYDEDRWDHRIAAEDIYAVSEI